MDAEERYFWDLLARRDPPRFGKFDPFMLVFWLGGPICLTSPWLNLDGLLAHLMLFYGLQEEYFLLPKKKKLNFPAKWTNLPLKRTGDIYHASTSLLEPNLPVRVTNMYKRFETQGAEHLTAKKIRRGQGYFRDYIMRQPYIAAKEVYFFGCGAISTIADLLSEYLIGLGNDFRVGWGPVREWSIEKVGEDRSLVHDGVAMRPIPVSMCSEYEDVVPMAYKPPYWDPRNVENCVPPGAKCKLKG